MMEQRSTEWHAERRGVINASEAGGLLGLNPYTSAAAARKAWIARLHGKQDRDIGHLPDVRRGVELEPEILNRIEELHGTIVQQDGGRRHGGWLRASADGFDDGHVYEVKAPRKMFNLIDRPDYALQLYLQMLCYKRELGVFVQGVEVDGKLLIKDDTYTFDDLAEIIDQHTDGSPPVDLLYALWESMLAEPAPEAAEAPEGFEDASTYYLTAKAAHDEAKARLDEAKAAVLAVTQNSPAVGERLMVIESTRQGSVNVKALSKAHPEIDLDQYRSAPTTYLQLREVKA